MNELAANIYKLLEAKEIPKEEMGNVLEALSKNLDRAELCNSIFDCSGCKLCKSTSHKVPGEGPRSSLMIIGES